MRCTIHLNYPAVGYCCGCGNFFCEECLSLCSDDKNYCKACMQKLGKHLPGYEGPARDARLAVKIIVKFRNGKTLKGTTYTLDPERASFHFLRHGSRRGDDEVETKYSDVEYVAIVDSFTGKRRSSPGEYQPKGSEVSVQFKSGETLDGYTLKHYNAREPRFSVIPRDAKDNRISILVERGAVAKMTLGRIPKAQELRKLVDNSVRRLILHYYWQHPNVAVSVEELARKLERTAPAVERELAIFIDEGLVSMTERQLRFKPAKDIVVREAIASMGKEIEMLYFRKRRPAKPAARERRGSTGPGYIRRR